MTPLEGRYLSRRVCAFCEQPLDRDWCGAIWEKCDAETIAKRRADCLQHYRPRKPKEPRP